MVTIVVNKKSGQPFDVYIGRGGIWGNPFPMRDYSEAERKRVIAEFETYLRDSPELLRRLPELHGKRLACFCAPKACHGHILAAYADAVTATGHLPQRITKEI